MKHFYLLSALVLCMAGKAQTLMPLSYSNSTVNVCLDIPKTIAPTPVETSKNMIVEDFDNDGLNDVLLSDSTSHNIYLYQNVGGASFNQSVVYNYVSAPVSFDSKFAIDAADFDNDGYKDIAFVFNGALKVLRHQQTSPPTFSLAYSNQTLTLLSTGPNFVRAAEIYTSSAIKNDLLIISKPATGTGLRVYGLQNTSPGAGNLNITFKEDYNTIAFPTLSVSAQDTLDFSIGDMNNDKIDDAFFCNRKFNNKIYAFKGSIVGTTMSLTPTTFTASLSVGNPSIALSKVRIVDADGDGQNDFLALAQALAPNQDFNGIAFLSATNTPQLANFNIPSFDISGNSNQLLSLKAVTHATPSLIQVNFDPIMDFDVGDIDGDGLKDIVAMNTNSLYINLQITDPDPFTPSQIFSNSNQPNKGLSLKIQMPAGHPASEMRVLHFDKNNRSDIFFKPLYVSGRGGVILNLSHKINMIKAGLDTLTCPGNTASFSAAITPSLQWPYSFSWYTKVQGTASLVANSQSVSVDVPGVYYPVINIPFPTAGGNNVCTIKGSNSNKDTIHVTMLPTPTVTPTKDVVIVCPNTTATLSATGTGSGNIVFDWKKNGAIVASATPSMVTGPVGGLEMYEVIGTDASQCVGSNTVFVNLFPENQDKIIADKNPVCLGDSVKLSFPGVKSYTWTTFASDQNDPFVYIKPREGRTIDLEYIDTNNCKNIQVIRINVDLVCDIKLYNSVTPNGDLVNDVWYIDNITRYPDNYITIYNRWGMKVFDTKGYDNTYNYWPPKDVDLPASTYFYVIDLDGKSEKLKGWIELIK